MDVRFSILTETGNTREVASVELEQPPRQGDIVMLVGPAFDEDPVPQFSVDAVQWTILFAGTNAPSSGSVQVLLSLVTEEPLYRPWCVCSPAECMPIGVENNYGTCNNCGDRVGPKHLKHSAPV